MHACDATHPAPSIPSIIIRSHPQNEKFTKNQSLMLFLFLFMCGFLAVTAILPPGYEDELYCPANSCLRRKTDIIRGFVGPRSALYECFKTEEESSTKPKPWGFRLDPEVKQKLKDDGYVQTTCPK